MPVRWQCPVALSTGRYSTKSDVYSFGVLLYEIFSSGATPYGDLTAGEVCSSVMAGHRLQRPSASTPEAVASLLWQCVALDVASRPAMREVEARLRALLMSAGDGSSSRSSPATAQAAGADADAAAAHGARANAAQALPLRPAESGGVCRTKDAPDAQPAGSATERWAAAVPHLRLTDTSGAARPPAGFRANQSLWLGNGSGRASVDEDEADETHL